MFCYLLLGKKITKHERWLLLSHNSGSILILGCFCFRYILLDVHISQSWLQLFIQGSFVAIFLLAIWNGIITGLNGVLSQMRNVNAICLHTNHFYKNFTHIQFITTFITNLGRWSKFLCMTQIDKWWVQSKISSFLFVSFSNTIIVFVRKFLFPEFSVPSKARFQHFQLYSYSCSIKLLESEIFRK